MNHDPLRLAERAESHLLAASAELVRARGILRRLGREEDARDIAAVGRVLGLLVGQTELPVSALPVAEQDEAPPY